MSAALISFAALRSLRYGARGWHPYNTMGRESAPDGSTRFYLHAHVSRGIHPRRQVFPQRAVYQPLGYLHSPNTLAETRPWNVFHLSQ